MKINESSPDSILRVFSGFFLLYLGLSSELAGTLAILVGVVGFCPIYTLFRGKK